MKRFTFVFLCSLIATIVSERMFWFWSTGVRVHVEVALFYMLPTAVVLWAIERFAVDDRSSLLLAVPLFAYVTEGVITPILYTGGPFVPFFPAWFSAWHGILGIAVGIVGIRLLARRGAAAALALTSVGFGAFWGLWATTLRLPENVEDPELVAEMGALVVLDPLAFARYAATFVAILIAAHWAIGFVWPAVEGSVKPTIGRKTAIVVGAFVAIAVVGWTVAIPWALPMFVAYGGLQIVALRRHHKRASSGAAERGAVDGGAECDGPVPGRSPLLSSLAGHVSMRNLAPIALMAPAASGVYAVLWAIDPSDQAIRVVMYSTIAVQTLVGGWMITAALLRERAPIDGDHEKNRSFPEKNAFVSASRQTEASGSVTVMEEPRG